MSEIPFRYGQSDLVRSGDLGTSPLVIPDALASLINPSAVATVLADGFLFSEGPSWSDADQALVFHDIPGDSRWRWSASAGLELLAEPTFKGNGTAYEPDGSLLICEQISSTVIRLRSDGSRDVVAFHYEGKYLNSPNDVVVSSDGSIYFTDPNYGRMPNWVGVERPLELDFIGVFRVPVGGGQIELVSGRDDFDQPNGLCFSPDETTLYVNDRHGLKAYDVAADGSLTGLRVLTTDMASGVVTGGNPDGMECDALGNVWCTARGGIWVIEPTGAVFGIIETPETAGSLAWGGVDFRTLFVTMTTKLCSVPTLVTGATLPQYQPPR